MQKMQVREPLAKVVNGDLLPHSGALSNWNFGEWNHHAPHSIPKMHSKWDCNSSTQTFAIGSRVPDLFHPARSMACET